MLGLPWLPRCILAATAVAAHVNGHQAQQPLRPESIHDSQPSPSPHPHHPTSDDDVDDPVSAPLFALHRDLVNINSISGHEHAIALYLETYLQSLNYTVERQLVAPPLTLTDPAAAVDDAFTIKPDSSQQQQQQQQQENQQRHASSRYNLLAHPPSHRNTPIILTTHIDTVPPFYPYSTRHHHHHQLLGRGSVDAKACIATQLFAARSLLTRSLIPSSAISHLFVVGEEIGGDGMTAANTLDLHPRAVIFGEPTQLRLASGHKGILIFRLHARGKAAHSGYPWLGASATGALVRALAALETMPLPWSDKYGNSTLNIGMVKGGVAANVVAENATAEVGVRLAGGEVEEVKNLIRETVSAAISPPPPPDSDYNGGDDSPATTITVDFYGGAYSPVDIDHDIPGLDNDTITVNFGTDIPNFYITPRQRQRQDPGSRGVRHNSRQYKRYLYGPGSIHVAHSDHEGLSRKEMGQAVDGYERIILHCYREQQEEEDEQEEEGQ